MKKILQKFLAVVLFLIVLPLWGAMVMGTVKWIGGMFPDPNLTAATQACYEAPAGLDDLDLCRYVAAQVPDHEAVCEGLNPAELKQFRAGCLDLRKNNPEKVISRWVGQEPDPG
jgi:hypothetical protein